MIHVRRTWDDSEGEVDVKTEAGHRSVPLTGRLRALIVEHGLTARRGGDDLVFGRTASDPFTPTTVRTRALTAWGWKRSPNPEPEGSRTVWVKAREDALDPLTPHEARHCAASYLIEAGLNDLELTPRSATPTPARRSGSTAICSRTAARRSPPSSTRTSTRRRWRDECNDLSVAKAWSFPQQDAWDAFNHHYGGRGSSHAVWALLGVESLFYIADMDDETFQRQRWYGASPEAADIAHVTAATGNAFSALDRCAASLAEINGVTTKSGNAVSVALLAPDSDNQARGASLSAGTVRWVDDLWADADYQLVRRPTSLFHAYTSRALYRPVPPGHGSRTQFDGVPVRALVLTSRDLADRYVERFLTGVIAATF